MAQNRADAGEDGADLLQALLEIPSPSGHEKAAVTHLVEWMSGRGFRAHRDEAGNAVGILAAPHFEAGRGRDLTQDGPSSSARDLVLLGHIDTVPGFPPVVLRDGRLYGRGAVDAKGPLAAFAMAAALVGPHPGWRVIVVGAVEEESTTSRGARSVIGQYHPAGVVIGEPTGWRRVALGYKGRLLANLTISRPMSHRAGPDASAPELALSYWNSVRARLETINSGRATTWEQVQGTLRGFRSAEDGFRETAQLTMGFRLPLHVTPDQLKADLRSLANGHSLSFHAEELAFRAEKNTALVRAFLSAIRAQGDEPGFVVKTGTSDMNIVGPAWGCPILAYGPGDSALDHTPEEHVELREWEKSVAVLADILRSITSVRVLHSE